MSERDNEYVHFRYHDLVSGLTGRHIYRYERVRVSEVGDLVRYLEAKGFDEFSVRPFKPYAPWCKVSDLEWILK